MLHELKNRKNKITLTQILTCIRRILQPWVYKHPRVQQSDYGSKSVIPPAPFYWITANKMWAFCNETIKFQGSAHAFVTSFLIG